ncbi:MAG: DUF2269 family protein [Bacteroidota bacterium]
MYPIHISLVVHFVGIGMLFTALFGGWIVNGQYRSAPDWPTKMLHLKTLRRVGLMSPLGVLVMLLSGIGNMTLGPHQYTVFSDGWLSAKLALFLVAILVGALSSFQSVRRSRMVGKLSAGETEKVNEGTLHSIEKQLRLSSLLQFVLILGIIILSVTRPLG